MDRPEACHQRHACDDHRNEFVVSVKPALRGDLKGACERHWIHHSVAYAEAAGVDEGCKRKTKRIDWKERLVEVQCSYRPHRDMSSQHWPLVRPISLVYDKAQEYRHWKNSSFLLAALLTLSSFA